MVLELVDRLVGQVPENIDRAGFDRRETRGRLRDDAHGDAVELGQALLEIVWVLLELQAVAGDHGLELERASADRLGRNVVDLVLGHDAELALGEDVRESRHTGY